MKNEKSNEGIFCNYLLGWYNIGARDIKHGEVAQLA